MTANLLAAVPPLIFFLIFQRKIVETSAISGSKELRRGTMADVKIASVSQSFGNVEVLRT